MSDIGSGKTLLICEAGFEYLQTDISGNFRHIIADEAVGLPIIVQQVCQSIFNAANIEFVDEARSKNIKLDRTKIDECLHDVASA